jgi:hypothetical protein
MQAQRKDFICRKTIVLGALYDAVDKLKWRLLSSNSETGMVTVIARETGILLLVTVSPKHKEQVEVTVELAPGALSGKDSPEEAAARLLKTLSLIIEDALAEGTL